jgi:hypothetical protein
MYIKKGKPYFGKKDTWDMHYVLAPIIAAGLVKFKEDWCVHPLAGLNGELTQWCVDQGMVSYTDDYDYSEEDWVKMEQVYLYMLDEMIYAFSSEVPEYEGDYEPTLPVKDRVHFKLMYGAHLVNLKAYHKRCDIGRGYFAEYFQSLWI